MGAAIDVAISPVDGSIYFVGIGSGKIYRHVRSEDRLGTYLSSVQADRVTADQTGQVWYIGKDKKVYQQSGNEWKVTKPFSYAKDISGSSNEKIWSCFATNGRVLSYANGKWDFNKSHGARAKRIAGRYSKEFWIIREDGSIKRFFKNKLRDIPGKAIDITVDQKSKKVYIIDLSGRIFIWNRRKKNWDLFPDTRSDFNNIAVHEGKIWCTTTNNEIYYSIPRSFGPISTSDNFKFMKNKPKVIVLVHGITLEASKNSAIKEKVNTYGHPQFYWGFDFIRGSAGIRSKELEMLEPPQNLFPTQKMLRDIWNNHHRSSMSHSKFLKNNPLAYILRKKGSDTDVMCTYRDGSFSLIKQTRDAINQIYDSYQSFYGSLPESKQPMIYLVAHSFGGIVCRTILSNPQSTDRSGDRLSTTDRKKADFIRNRTVWLTTLSTPHEGSPLPGLATNIDKGLKSLENNTSGDLKKAIKEIRVQHVAGDGACMQDIKHNDFYFKKWLNPKHARRTNGDLVPIYTLTGANPGHKYYLHKKAFLSPFDNSINDMNDHHSWDDRNLGYSKVVPESFQLMLLDYLSKSVLNPGTGIWPRVYSSVKEGDRFMTPRSDNLLADVLNNGIRIRMKKDGYFDSDGFVGFQSGHALKLGTNTINYFNNQKQYTVNNKKVYGSWYRIYGANYGVWHPWDLDNHRSICFNEGTGAFIGNYLLENGPFNAPGKWSTWRKGVSVSNLTTKKITLEFTYLKNLSGQEDFGTEGYRVEVKIGHGPFQQSGTIKEKQVISKRNFQKNKNYIWTFSKNIPNATLVPVIIRVINKRTALNDQICSTSKAAFIEEALLYIDPKNKRVYGEVEGPISNKKVNSINGNKDGKRPVKINFRIKIN